MSQICASWQKKHNAVAFESNDEHLHKTAGFKIPLEKTSSGCWLGSLGGGCGMEEGRTQVMKEMTAIV